MNTVLTKGFASKYLNCRPPHIQTRPPVIHLVAGISVDNGLEGYALSYKSINSSRFLRVLSEFDKNGNNYTLFGDNATWHTS